MSLAPLVQALEDNRKLKDDNANATISTSDITKKIQVYENDIDTGKFCNIEYPASTKRSQVNSKTCTLKGSSSDSTNQDLAVGTYVAKVDQGTSSHAQASSDIVSSDITVSNPPATNEYEGSVACSPDTIYTVGGNG